jgi:hypothetical protein
MSGIAGAVVGGDDKSVNLAAGAGANAAANNYLLHPDRTALNAAKAKLSASIADCNLACKDEAQKEVTRLEALDKANDDKWKSACDTNPSSPECTSQTKYTSLDLETQAKSARQPTVLNSLSTPTVTPTAACANNDPDCKAGISAGRNGDQYGRPDYLAVQVGVFGTGGSLSLNLHTGDLFWGLSQSVPVTPSLNLVTGNINGNSGPTSSEKGAVTNDFLGGASVQAGGCTSVICISGNKSIGGKEALEVGVGLPSPPTPVGGAGVSFPLPFRLPIGTPLQPIPPSVKEKP